jgi:hypothetical protein
MRLTLSRITTRKLCRNGSAGVQRKKYVDQTHHIPIHQVTIRTDALVSEQVTTPAPCPPRNRRWHMSVFIQSFMDQFPDSVFPFYGPRSSLVFCRSPIEWSASHTTRAEKSSHMSPVFGNTTMSSESESFNSSLDVSRTLARQAANSHGVLTAA